MKTAFLLALILALLTPSLCFQFELILPIPTPTVSIDQNQLQLTFKMLSDIFFGAFQPDQPQSKPSIFPQPQPDVVERTKTESRRDDKGKEKKQVKYTKTEHIPDGFKREDMLIVEDRKEGNRENIKKETGEQGKTVLRLM